MNTTIQTTPESLTPTPRPATQGQWFVLRTRSRQEKTVATNLAARGIDHFLPMVWKVRYYGRRKLKRQFPMFPGYVFLHGEAEQAWELDRGGRVAEIIRVSDQTRLDHELQQIRGAIGRDAMLQAHHYIKRGTRVVVRSGPFAGIEGVVESQAKDNRLVLQVAELVTGAALEIDYDLLEPLD